VIYLLSPGLDSCNDELIAAFDETFKGALIFGGASSDRYNAVATSQYILDKASQTGIWAVGFADKTLKAAARATHGFKAYGAPMTVTKARHNFIEEFDGMNAWEAYTRQAGGMTETDLKSALVSGGLALPLPEKLAAEYGNGHILRLGLPVKETGAIRLSVTAHEGEQWFLTARDEDLIFSEQKKALEILREPLSRDSTGGVVAPVAVFHTDCLLRGKALFDTVMKEEKINMIQSALSAGGETPPWLGMYGFGEYCPLAGLNTFHTYTTSLLALYR
jgi:hypothetical protein